MEDLCQNKDIGMSCFGCCGHSYTSEEEVMKDIELDTKEFPSLISEYENINQKFKCLRKSGICRAVVHLGNNQVGCGLHPIQNKGSDLRDETCDKKHKCLTIKKYEKWDEQKRKNFIDFIKEKIAKGMTVFQFSKSMDDNSLVRKFEKKS